MLWRDSQRCRPDTERKEKKARERLQGRSGRQRESRSGQARPPLRQGLGMTHAVSPRGVRCDTQPTLKPPGTDRDVISRQSPQEGGRREGRGRGGRHMSWIARRWGDLGPDRQTRSLQTERKGHMGKIIQRDLSTQTDTARDTVILTTHGDTTRKDCP